MAADIAEDYTEETNDELPLDMLESLIATNMNSPSIYFMN